MKIIAEYVTATIQGGSPETRQRLFDLTAFLRVNLKLDMRSPEHWYLTTLARTRHNPGAGATVLQALHVLADKECASIRLRAGDPWKRRNADLIRYYEQFGYIVRGLAIHDGRLGNDMIRMPRSAWPRI
jgi:hypothetical protein